MDESTSPAQCSAIAQLQVSIKLMGYKFHWAMFVRHRWKSGGCYVCRDACGSIGCPVSVKMRIVNDAGRCFACSESDQDEVKTTLLTPVMMTMQIDSYTVAGNGVPD